ncbi:uncharacterized protein [Aristolochia californica]|uniref:uncharacterized protein n=1 Tax=Aristolochia californica TaxID=171875 RepID=UPI0035E113D8
MSTSYAVLCNGFSKLPELGLRNFSYVVDKVILLVYVDDIIITSTDSSLITKLQQVLHATFHMKDLGQFTLEDTFSVTTHMEVNVKYKKDEGALLDDPTFYRRLVGSLIYLTLFTRTSPMLFIRSVSVCPLLSTFILRQFNASSAIYKVLLFVDYSFLQALHFNWLPTVMLIGLGALIPVTLLQFHQTSPTPLHADNTSAIQIVVNSVFHERTKNSEVDCHSIRNILERQLTLSLNRKGREGEQHPRFFSPLSVFFLTVKPEHEALLSGCCGSVHEILELKALVLAVSSTSVCHT